MSGIRGIGFAQLEMLQQLTKTKGKRSAANASSNIDASFNITSNIPSSRPGTSASDLFFEPFEMTSHFSGSRMMKLPEFDGLSKAEPTITEDELRQAVIELAQKDAARGIQYGENHKELESLINRLVCGVSPDRKGIIEDGSKGSMVPAGDSGFVLGRLVDKKTNGLAAFYTQGSGWVLASNHLTKEERAAGDPFYRLYNDAFTGKYDGSDTAGNGSSLNVSADGTRSQKAIDYKA